MGRHSHDCPDNCFDECRNESQPPRDAISPPQRKWDRRFLELAALFAGWSKDPSTKVGCVVVDEFNRPVAMGYNGFPRGVDDTVERYDERMVKYKLVVHAEANAIVAAAHQGQQLRGTTLYCTHHPCSECAKLIAQAGVGRVVSVAAASADMNVVWREDRSFAQTIFRETGIQLDVV